MTHWMKQMKKYKKVLLAYSITALIVTSISAQFFNADGGIFDIVSAVLFDTNLYEEGEEGWVINLHAGGLEGFGVSGYYRITDFFLGTTVLLLISVLYLYIKPGKASMSILLILQFLIHIHLTINIPFDIALSIICLIGWILLIYLIVLMRRYERLARIPESDRSDR